MLKPHKNAVNAPYNTAVRIVFSIRCNLDKVEVRNYDLMTQGVIHKYAHIEWQQ